MRMRSLLFTLIFLIPFAACYHAQEDVHQSMIVVHVEPGGGTQLKQQIFSYHFLNGSFIGRDELMTVPGRKDGKDYIRTDIGTGTIYKDRYLITGIGNILDLQEKKVLFDGRASLVRCSNDSAVFYTNDIFKGKFYSVYDFKKGQYAEVKDLLFNPKIGQDVEFDKTGRPYKLYYYPQGKPKITLTEDAGYGQQGTGGSASPDPPLLWLSHSELLYAHFNKENTELSFYKINLGSNHKKLMGKVAITPEKRPAMLTRLNDKELVLELGSQQVFVDLKAETAAELEYTRSSCGFSFACKASAAGRLVKLNGKEVGKFHFNPSTFTCGKNIAGFVKELSVGEESYQQGLSVWNATSNSWASVEADEVLTVLGWINR